MEWTHRVVLVAACLLATHSSVAENTTKVLQTQSTRNVTQPDPIHVASTKVGITMAVIFGSCLLFRELALGIFDKLATDKEHKMHSSYTHYNRKDTYYNHPSLHEYHSQPSYYRSLVDDDCFLARIFYSIDPVESAFALLQVDELACRRRTVCELQREASRIPLMASLLMYVSRYIRGLEAYREAQEAGAALEDCALLFSECTTTAATLVQTSEPRSIPARPA